MDFQWIPISEDLIYQDLKIITSKGFTILSQLMIDADRKDYSSTSLIRIQKYCNIKDIRTIRKHLLTLTDLGYISYDVDISKINKNYNIEIYIYKEKMLNSKYYEIIPIQLFEENIDKIKNIGWALFCTLCLYFNSDYGYAYPNYKQLQLNIGISHTTLYKYIKILIENKLIKIKDQEKVFLQNNEEWKFSRNKYIINFMFDKDWVKFKKR